MFGFFSFKHTRKKHNVKRNVQVNVNAAPSVFTCLYISKNNM